MANKKSRPGVHPEGGPKAKHQRRGLCRSRARATHNRRRHADRDGDWLRYEQLKQNFWNRNLSPTEYEAAIRGIVRYGGV